MQNTDDVMNALVAFNNSTNNGGSPNLCYAMDDEVDGRRCFKTFTIDAFTNYPLGGNSATVVFLEKDMDLCDDTKQRIANEMSFSETAFVSKKKADDPIEACTDFFLRWFTPKNEVPLCGHATLATAHAIFNYVGNRSNRISFETKSGTLYAIREQDKIMLNLPARQNKQVNKDIYKDLIRVVVGERFMNEVKEVRYSTEEMKLMVRLNDHITMRQLESFIPKPDKMVAFNGGNLVLRGVTVTLRGSRENGCVDTDTDMVYDFASRHFSPWYGIPEDPVTGSAHTVLGPYWAEVLGKTSLYARQASERGGDLYIRVRTDHRIEIGGNSVMLMRGEIYL